MSKDSGGVRLSVLDRLMDGSPREGAAANGPVTWDSSPETFKRAFLRDLEWLLNTRRVAEPAPERYPLLERSLYHFGIPDITSLSADSPDAHHRLAQDIEQCLCTFEPRLSSPRVSVAPKEENGGRGVRFVIDAVLRMDPFSERIVVDTLLETSTGTFKVTGGEHA